MKYIPRPGLPRELLLVGLSGHHLAPLPGRVARDPGRAFELAHGHPRTPRGACLRLDEPCAPLELARAVVRRAAVSGEAPDELTPRRRQDLKGRSDTPVASNHRA
jgi:hypothetical protein